MLRLLTLLAVITLARCANITELFNWKEVSFAWDSEEIRESAISSGAYIPENNLPLGVGRWHDKLFVTVPRWKAGVGSTLNYIDLNTKETSPALIPYPSWKSNFIPADAEKLDENHLVSVFRIHIDECDRLWIMETGLADILGSAKLLSKTALIIYDLNTDTLLRRYEFKPSDLKESSFFANVIVDVPPGKCDEAFAYAPDLGGYGLVVYSWKANDSWRIKHNFFHFDPLNGNFNVGGVNFQWTDGIFGLALSRVRDTFNGYRTLYFHPLASTRQFSVSTEILRNHSRALDHRSYHLFRIEGNKGPLSQASGADLDDKTDVLFMTQLQRDGVACWNTKKPLTHRNLALIAQDHTKLVFTNDVKIDHDRILWILSDRMPVFLFGKLNPDDINYRIFKVPVDEAIVNTPCAN